MYDEKRDVGIRVCQVLGTFFFVTCLGTQAANDCPPAKKQAPANIARDIRVLSEQWAEDKVIAGLALKGERLRCLPESVEDKFRDSANYDADGHISSKWWNKPIGRENNCSSFAINRYENSLYGGTAAGNDAVMANPTCETAERAFKVVPELHAEYAKGKTGSLSCPAENNAYIIVPYIGHGGMVHVVRQLDNGQFAHISGLGGQLQLLYLQDSPGAYFPLNRYADLPDSENMRRCAPICISPGKLVSGTSPISRGPDEPTRQARNEISGNWTAVTPDQNARPLPYRVGVTCGPFLQRIYLAVGVTDEFFGTLIPGAVGGPEGVALEIHTHLIGPTSEREEFGYGGVNLVFAAKVSSTRAQRAIAFHQFHDRLRPPVNRKTKQRIPRLVEPSGGVMVRIVKVSRDTMETEIGWDSPCASKVLFHRTRLIRGTPESGLGVFDQGVSR